MGRIAAQTFRQVLSQRIREVERDRKFEEYANREGDIVTGIVQQLDNRYTLLDLGKVEALLPQAEQVPFERPEAGARLKAYIVEVRRTPKAADVVRTRNVILAAELDSDDDAIDVLHHKMFEVLMDEHWPHGVRAAVDVTLLARYYERFADHPPAVGWRGRRSPGTSTGARRLPI